MDIKQVITDFWKASEAKKVCRITLEGEPLPRLVHPYGICKTSAGKIVLVCKQVTGFTKTGGKAGYRNLRLDRIDSVEILEESFDSPTDFNAQDVQYQEWVYHI